MIRHKLAVAVGVSAAALIGTIAPTAATADHNANPIHPGVQTITAGGQCTSNFVFRDGAGTYLGQAAHCSSTGAATSTNGCEAESLPLGTPVQIEGATQPGTMVYNSWLAMRAAGEADPNTCAYNDFALVRIDPADVASVDPTIPGFGGPTGVGPSSAMLGDTVYSYGNSSLRLGIAQLRPKQGIVVQSVGGGWSRTVYTVTPGIPGDSGSAFLSASGEAIGVLSTLQLLPVVASNGVGDLAHELAYMNAHGSSAQLVPGNRPFRPNLVQAIIGD